MPSTMGEVINIAGLIEGVHSDNHDTLESTVVQEDRATSRWSCHLHFTKRKCHNRW